MSLYFPSRRSALALLGAAVAGDVLAVPVAPALDRAAVAVRSGERSVLLGAARAGERIVAVGERGLVLLSDDGARTWRQAIVPVSVTLTAVRFADAKRGFVVGHGGVVMATADGGDSWTLRLDGKRIAQLALQAAKAAGDAAKLQEAERLVADGPDKPLLDLNMIDAQRLLVVGAYGLAFATEDAGQSWVSWMDRLPNPKSLHLYALRRRGDLLLLAGEQGLALLSADGGRSFRPLAVPYNGSFFTAEFTGASGIALAGLRGNLWQSADAGASWKQLPVPVPASITASAMRADGEFLFANQAGLVLALRDGVVVPLGGPPLPPLNGLLPLAGHELLALSIQGAITVTARAAK